MTNELFLEVSDGTNPKVLRIFDTSHYCDDTVLENYIVEILPVNKSTWRPFFVQKGFSLVLNSSNLAYKKVADTDGLISLPDGIYEIKQSYKPNIYTIQHYLHLRTTDLRKKIRSEWNKLVDKTCKLTESEFQTNRDKLREIEEFLLAAKFKVEDCHEKTQGKELYDWAVKLLEQYTNECQC